MNEVPFSPNQRSALITEFPVSGTLARSGIDDSSLLRSSLPASYFEFSSTSSFRNSLRPFTSARCC